MNAVSRTIQICQENGFITTQGSGIAPPIGTMTVQWSKVMGNVKETEEERSRVTMKGPKAKSISLENKIFLQISLTSAQVPFNLIHF